MKILSDRRRRWWVRQMAFISPLGSRAGSGSYPLVTMTPIWPYLYDNSRYTQNETIHGEFWRTVGLARFEVGELELTHHRCGR